MDQGLLQLPTTMCSTRRHERRGAGGAQQSRRRAVEAPCRCRHHRWVRHPMLLERQPMAAHQFALAGRAFSADAVSDAVSLLPERTRSERATSEKLRWPAGSCVRQLAHAWKCSTSWCAPDTDDLQTTREKTTTFPASRPPQHWPILSTAARALGGGYPHSAWPLAAMGRNLVWP